MDQCNSTAFTYQICHQTQCKNGKMMKHECNHGVILYFGNIIILLVKIVWCIIINSSPKDEHSVLLQPFSSCCSKPV